MQKKLYRIAGKTDSGEIAEFLSRDGQLLLPFLELVCNTEQAVDKLIDVAGRAGSGIGKCQGKSRCSGSGTC